MADGGRTGSFLVDGIFANARRQTCSRGGQKSAKEKSDSGGRRLAGPNAPTKEAAETKEGGGFLKRLFGFGKKKS